MDTITLNVLITGASGGIGAATAVRLAGLSGPYIVKNLLLHYHAAPPAVRDALTSQITAANPSVRVSWLQGDLADTAAVGSLAENAEAAIGTDDGPINVLFANHGTHLDHAGPATGSLHAVSLDVFERTWRVNTFAPYHLTKLLVPAMTASGFGRVIYTSSVAGVTGGIVGPHYASSKSALHGLLHYCAGALASQGVTFNAVAPALIAGTAMLPGGVDELSKKIPVGRLGTTAEIADVVKLMVENGYVSNKVWAVDGGMVPM